MAKRQHERGSAHVVIIIILIVALLGALGWIFWQNFILKQSNTSSDKPVVIKQKTTPTAPAQPTLKTYTDSATGVSFRYPSNWSVSATDMNGSNMVTVTDANDKTVAYLEENLSGRGGAAPPVSYTTLATQVKSAGLFDCALFAAGTNLYYGLTGITQCAQTGSGTIGGPVSLEFAFDTGLSKLGMISFSNIDFIGTGAGTQDNITASQARQFVASNEYRQIQAMFASLKY